MTISDPRRVSLELSRAARLGSGLYIYCGLVLIVLIGATLGAAGLVIALVAAVVLARLFWSATDRISAVIDDEGLRVCNSLARNDATVFRWEDIETVDRSFRGWGLLPIRGFMLRVVPYRSTRRAAMFLLASYTTDKSTRAELLRVLEVKGEQYGFEVAVGSARTWARRNRPAS